MTFIDIAKAGLNRFYDEGYTVWPKSKLQSLFSNHSLESEEVMSELLSWDKEKWINLRKEDNQYLIMLSIIPD